MHAYTCKVINKQFYAKVAHSGIALHYNQHEYLSNYSA